MLEIIVRVRLQQSVQIKMPKVVVLVIDNCMSLILERVDSPSDDFLIHFTCVSIKLLKEITNNRIY